MYWEVAAELQGVVVWGLGFEKGGRLQGAVDRVNDKIHQISKSSNESENEEGYIVIPSERFWLFWAEFGILAWKGLLVMISI